MAIVAMNPMMLEFAFGCLISLIYAKTRRRKTEGIALFSLGVGISLVMSYIPVTCANGMQMIVMNQGVWHRVATWGILAALIVGGMVLWSPAMESKGGKLLVALGDSSYSTYLSSALVMMVLVRAFEKVVKQPRTLSYAAVLATQVLFLILTLAAGWVVYRFLEKPLHAWSRKVTAAKPLSS